MSAAIYRVESSRPMFGPLLPYAGAQSLAFVDRELATIVAAKSATKPYGHEIRVIHVPTGKVIFRKPNDGLVPVGDDL